MKIPYLSTLAFLFREDYKGHTVPQQQLQGAIHEILHPTPTLNILDTFDESHFVRKELSSKIKSADVANMMRSTGLSLVTQGKKEMRNHPESEENWTMVTDMGYKLLNIHNVRVNNDQFTAD